MDKEITITLTVEQAKLLKLLLNYNIDEYTYRDIILMPKGANEVLADTLWNKLNEELTNV